MTKNVNLAVSNSAQTGYTSTAGSNGNTYYFAYTGGDDGHGNITETVGSPEDISVVLDTSGYSIDTVGFSNDPNNQLGWSRISDTSVTITDADTIAESDAHYGITAKLTSTGETFVCDPRVTNQD